MTEAWQPLQAGQILVSALAREPLKLLTMEPRSLTDLLREGVLFTHAAILCCFPQLTDPLGDLAARREIGMHVVMCRSSPFFQGFRDNMPDARWEHSLLWTPAASWPIVRATLDDAQFLLPERVCSGRWIETTVPDTFKLDHAAVLPKTVRASVYGYAVRDAAREIQFVEPEDPWKPTRVEVRNATRPIAPGAAAGSVARELLGLG